MRPPVWLRTFCSRANLGPNLLVIWLLAFGLGASALLYSAADRLVLRPIPVTHASRLVRAGIRRGQLVTRDYFTYKQFEIARRVRAFRGVAVDAEIQVSVSRSAAQFTPALGHMVSGRYFELLEGVPEVGRVLNPSDDQANAAGTAVVLSHAFCTELFGSTADAVGSTVRIQREPFTVIGVMPKRFFGISLDTAADLWVPSTAEALLSGKSLRDPQSERSFSIFARLSNGSTSTTAAAEFGSLYKADARANRDENPGILIIEPINKGAFSEHDRFSRALLLLACGFAILLAMMTINVAALLLVRSARRARAIAIEVSLGASSARIIRASLLESLSLGMIGAVGAIVLIYVFAPLLVHFLPPGRVSTSVYLRASISTTLLVPVSAAFLSLLFGATPAWRASHLDPQQVLRSGSATRHLSVWTRVLLILQVAGAALILIESALLFRTWQSLLSADIGFDDRNLVAFTIEMSTNAAPTRTVTGVASHLVRGARDLPGVLAASIATAPLMHGIGLKTSVALAGTKIGQHAFLNTSFNEVSESFFATLKIPIHSGRALSASDEKAVNPIPVVVNAGLARLLFGGADPIGQRFGSGPPGSVAGPRFVIVGIAGDSRYRSLREAMAPIYYRPFEDSNSASSFTLYVRAKSRPSDVIRTMQVSLSGLKSSLAYLEISTVRQQAIDSVWPERLIAVLGLMLSAVSDLIAMTGLYGLLAYDISQRQREFGIRLAVGATARTLGAMLGRESGTILGLGLLAALLVHATFAPVLKPYLFGVHPFDAGAISTALLCFAVIGTAAVWEPIRKAIAISPRAIMNDQG